MAVPYTFANATVSIPLSQLDSNFATAITLGNTAIQLGNTVTTLNNMTMANVTISSVATAITAAEGGTGLTTITANSVMLGNGTNSVQVVAPGTSGNILTSDGTTWKSLAPAASGVTSFNAGTTGFTPNSATTGAVTLAGTLAEANGGTGTNTGYYGFKNRIINGAMMIDQRNAGASVTPTVDGNYSLDRWRIDFSQASKMSFQQNAGSVTPPSGFVNYLGITSLAATSVGSTDYFSLEQRIEGYNTADLGWGTASASPVTLSFWVRSSLTGTFGGSLRNASINRSYPYTYTINAANTWEYKTVTVAGDTSGTWGTSNGVGITVFFGLGVGSTYSGTAGSWAGANYQSATGATSVVGTNGATFYITGVQLEKGSTATSFDYRPYGTELALCQRYYAKLGALSTFAAFGTGFAGGTTYANIYVKYPVAMRAAPTVSQSNTNLNDGANTAAISSLGATYAGTDSLHQTINATVTQYRPYGWWAANNSAGYVDLTAEL